MAKIYLIKVFDSVKIAFFFVFLSRKYVQVCVQNLSELDFQLSGSDLVDTRGSTGLRLTPLNTEAQQVPPAGAEREREGGGRRSGTAAGPS